MDFIQFPDDLDNEICLERIKALMEKRDEYIERVNYAAERTSLDKQESFFVLVGNSIYKAIIADRFLTDGIVDEYELGAELEQSQGYGFDSLAFESAFRVIKDYVKTGGKRLTGGTGFGANRELEI